MEGCWRRVTRPWGVNGCDRYNTVEGGGMRGGGNRGGEGR